MRWWIGIVLFSSQAIAQVYSPQATELRFSYQATFVTTETQERAWKELANLQLSHLFGNFHSPALIESFGLDSYFVGGIGAVQFPVDLDVQSVEKLADGSRLVTYRAKGTALMHNEAIRKLLRDGLDVPLPMNLAKYYDRRCTDKHYQDPGDFWYFFDPNRKGCEGLRAPPLANLTHLDFSPGTRRKLDLDMRLDLLRADNANGDLFRIDVVHGFSDSAVERRDGGRASFLAFQRDMISRGFHLKELQKYDNRPLVQYSKELKLKSGRRIQVEVRDLLVETTISERGITFAKFFQRSVEEADVFFYAGHSGLGGNLDVEALERKVGGFHFNLQKRQIFIFDSCSSYSYYLYPFRAEKTRARIDIVTNGLSSYFDLGPKVLGAFMDTLLDVKVDDHSWPDALQAVEAQMDGFTYLMNVGGI